jgi:transaldolase/glucose-6-phosphate isomerase
MASNPLTELGKHGQAFWYDNIRRGLITSGELQRLIDEDGLVGVTSNPTIFEKAISGSTDYDEHLHELVDRGKDVPEILRALTVRDIQMAADLFRLVYERTGRRDGYVSIEVSPKLARDTEGTIAEALRLREAVGRENVMIKVPGTPEGMPAIEELTARGVNVNVTLLFSLESYRHAAEAYIAGLERLAHAGGPLDRVASVASFFLSRVDTAVDRLLEARLRETSDVEQRAVLEGLLGKAAIANAGAAYTIFKEIFSGARFAKLRQKGARVQRPLWASTGTKNPNYSDVYYIEPLIGPETVNTMPQATITAFRDHGTARSTLVGDLEGAGRTLERLAEAGVDMDAVTDRLLEEGIDSFVASFDKLLELIRSKHEGILASLAHRQSASLGQHQTAVEAAQRALKEQQLCRRLWEKDATIWSREPDVQRSIKNRLGWLTVSEAMTEHLDDLRALGSEVREAGFAHAVLLGMGGSSLCPEVLRLTFGPDRGYPDLTVLDSTDPATILSIDRAIDAARTLFIVATKSGTTTETLSLYKHFFERVQATKAGRAGDNFIAITDAGTPLERLASDQGFRRVFINPSDIGGRYSALSYFGLVPAAVMGIDIDCLLDRAEEMAQSSVSCVPVRENPGARLGAIMKVLAKAGRDKVTFVLSPGIESFGTWAEQLIAESTGKEGKGILPVDGEPLGGPAAYGADRLFVYLRLDGAFDRELDGKVGALEKAGHPVVRLHLRDPYDLGGEFFRWELATAIAGSLLGINPFDEPNVRESKDNTCRLLDEFAAKGTLPEGSPALEQDGLKLYADSALGGSEGKASLESYMSAFLRQTQPGDYVALLAYIQRSPEHEAALQSVRRRLRDGLRLATTLGYGPRYLHSTGQLHKGGAANGLFLQVTADDQEDVTIPGEGYTFSILKRAQALGDLISLQSKGRRVVRVHLKNIEDGLRELERAVEGALAGVRTG